MLRGIWTAGTLLAGLELGFIGAACAQSPEKAEANPAQAQAGSPGGSAKKGNPFTGDSAAIAEGKKLWFKYNCYGCHGTEGGGGMGASVIDASWVYGGDDASVFNTVKNGQGRMPPLGQIAQISDEEIWKIIAFMRSLYKGDPDEIVW